MSRTCINKRLGASLSHLTHYSLGHGLVRERGAQKRKRKLCLVVLVLACILAYSILRKFFAGFFPIRVFPGYILCSLFVGCYLSEDPHICSIVFKINNNNYKIILTWYQSDTERKNSRSSQGQGKLGFFKKVRMFEFHKNRKVRPILLHMLV